MQSNEFLKDVLTNGLFSTPEIPSQLDETVIASLPRCKTSASRSAAYEMLLSICKGDPMKLVDVLQVVKSVNESATKIDSWDYAASEGRKSETGYVGIKNLGAICYMSAMLQQFFMVSELVLFFVSLLDSVDYRLHVSF